MNRQSATNILGNTYGCFKILEVKETVAVVQCIHCNQIYEKSFRMLTNIVTHPLDKCIMCNGHRPGIKYGSIEVIEKIDKSKYKIHCHNCDSDLTISASTMTLYKETCPTTCKLCAKRQYRTTKYNSGDILGCYTLINRIKGNNWLVECNHCKKRQEFSITNIKKTNPEKCYFCDKPNAIENPYASHRAIYEDIDERIYAYYKSRILSKNEQGFKYKEWKLSLEEYKQLIHGDCFYCGVKPSTDNMWNNPKNKRKSDPGLIAINGIDRIDASKGYVFDNCVSCCSSCNAMKSDLSQTTFFEKISKIYQKHCSETIEKPLNVEPSRVESSDSKQNETINSN